MNEDTPLPFELAGWDPVGELFAFLEQSPVAGAQLGAIGDAFNDFVNGPAEILRAVGRGVQRLAEWAWEWLGGVGRYVFNGVQDAITWLTTLQVNLLRGSWAYVTQHAGGAIGWLRDVIAYIGDGLVSYLVGGARWIIGVPGGAVGWVLKNLRGASEWVSGVEGGMLGWLERAIYNARDGLLTWISWLEGRVRAVLFNTWGYVADHVGGAVGWLKDLIVYVGGGIVGAVQALPETFARQLVGGARWIFDLPGGLSHFLARIARGSWDFIDTYAGGAAGWLYSNIVGAIIGGAQGIGGAFEAAFRWFRDNVFGTVQDGVEIMADKALIPIRIVRGEYDSLGDLVQDLMRWRTPFLIPLLIAAVVILPLVQTVIAQSAQPLIEKQLQQIRARVPTQLPTVGEMLAGWNRGIVDENTVGGWMAAYGYAGTPERLLKELRHQIPGPSDLVRFAVREAFDPAQARALGYDTPLPGDFSLWMQRQGYDNEWATRYWWAHWDLPSIGQGMEMLHRREISLDDVRALLRALDVPPLWHDRFINIAYNPFTRVDARRMHKLGVLNDQQLLESYLDIGYDQTKAAALVEFTKRYNAPEDRSEIEDRRDAMGAEVRKAYRKRLIDRNDAIGYMVDAGYAADDANFWLAVDDLHLTLNPLDEEDPDVRNLTAAAILRAYREDLFDRARTSSELVALGYPPISADVLISLEDKKLADEVTDLELRVVREQYQARQITREATSSSLRSIGLSDRMIDLTLLRWDLENATGRRRLTPTQTLKAWEKGLFDDGEVFEELASLGYNDRDANILVALQLPAEEE